MSLLYLYLHLIIIFLKKIKKLVFLRIHFPIFCFYLYCILDFYYQYMFYSFIIIWPSHYNMIKKIIAVIVINLLWYFLIYIFNIDICISVFICIVIILVCTYIFVKSNYWKVLNAFIFEIWFRYLYSHSMCQLFVWFLSL